MEHTIFNVALILFLLGVIARFCESVDFELIPFLIRKCKSIRKRKKESRIHRKENTRENI